MLVPSTEAVQDLCPSVWVKVGWDGVARFVGTLFLIMFHKILLLGSVLARDLESEWAEHFSIGWFSEGITALRGASPPPCEAKSPNFTTTVIKIAAAAEYFYEIWRARGVGPESRHRTPHFTKICSNASGLFEQSNYDWAESVVSF